MDHRRRRRSVLWTAIIVELAKPFGGLLLEGWKPRRTIILAPGDGEEHGMLGRAQ